MSNHRYSKFWWQDWQGDKALHPCSMAARGFWMELLCIAHEGDPYGHVTIKGQNATIKQIAAIAACSEKDAKKWIAELEAAQVFSRTAEGVIWCRRMVNDHEAEEKFRDIGRQGGNPSLKRRVNPPNNPPDNGGGNGRVNRGGYPQPSEAESEAESLPPKAPPSPGGRRGAPRYRNGFLQVIADEGMPSLADRADQPDNPVANFLVKYGNQAGG